MIKTTALILCFICSLAVIGDILADNAGTQRPSGMRTTKTGNGKDSVFINEYRVIELRSRYDAIVNKIKTFFAKIVNYLKGFRDRVRNKKARMQREDKYQKEVERAKQSRQKSKASKSGEKKKGDGSIKKELSEKTHVSFGQDSKSGISKSGSYFKKADEDK